MNSADQQADFEKKIAVVFPDDVIRVLSETGATLLHWPEITLCDRLQWVCLPEFGADSHEYAAARSALDLATLQLYEYSGGFDAYLFGKGIPTETIYRVVLQAIYVVIEIKVGAVSQ